MKISAAWWIFCGRRRWTRTCWRSSRRSTATGGDQRIVGSLMEAVRNGKQVTAVVELKARFEEANNILWARRLEGGGGSCGLRVGRLQNPRQDLPRCAQGC